jgi:nucleotide-binding universal stress UspA family protein
MYSRFSNILVPVDLSQHTEVAVSRARSLLDREQAFVRLYHVVREGAEDLGQALHQLRQWKEMLEEGTLHLNVDIRMDASPSVQEAITRMAIEQKAELVIIAQTARHHLFSKTRTLQPVLLAQNSQVPVLTIKPGSLHHPIRVVIVPVCGNLSPAKLAVLERICRVGKPVIHLLKVSSPSAQEQDGAELFPLYQWLKGRLHCQMEYAVTNGHNRARAIMLYAQRQNADLLLLEPQTDTRIGWWHPHIPDALEADSKMQILTV